MGSISAIRPEPATPEELRAAFGRVGSGGPAGPTTAAHLSSAVPDGPIVRIRYRPGVCRTELQELFAPGEVTPDGCAGVDPEHVVKAMCRALDCGPGALTFESDPAARGLRGDHARCYLVTELGGERRAHIVGISFAWLQVEASRLASRGWRPGMNREVVAATPAEGRA